MKNFISLILSISFLVFTSCNDSESTIGIVEKPKTLKAEIVEKGVKLTWEETKSEKKIVYQIYSKVGDVFEIMGTTEGNHYTDDLPTIGENIYKVRAVAVDSENLVSEFSNEISIKVNSFKFVGSWKSDIKALYNIKHANPNSNLRWEFDFIDSDSPIIKNYNVIRKDGTGYDQVVFSVINGEERLTELVINESKVSDLSEVDKYTALTRLSCSSNSLSALDVSKNTALISLDCSSNSLSTLDVSKNLKLILLDCSSNSLSTLDIGRNTDLRVLFCNNNPLTTKGVTISKHTYNSALLSPDETTNIYNIIE